MFEVVPLVQCAYEPRDHSEQKTGAPSESGRNCDNGNWRELKYPPVRVESGAKINEESRRGPGRDNKKNVSSLHLILMNVGVPQVSLARKDACRGRKLVTARARCPSRRGNHDRLSRALPRLGSLRPAAVLRVGRKEKPR